MVDRIVWHMIWYVHCYIYSIDNMVVADGLALIQHHYIYKSHVTHSWSDLMQYHVDSLVWQNCSISTPNVLEILQYFTKSSMGDGCDDKRLLFLTLVILKLEYSKIKIPWMLMTT